MKANTITRIATAAVAMIASAVTANAANRTLILLQENSNGKSYMTDLLPAGLIRDAADAIIDGAAEGGEAVKLQALAAGRYQRFVNLTNSNCTRANLLNQLIKQSKEGFTVDLAILGHGGPESLNLHNNEKLTGRTVETVTTPTGTTGQLVRPGSIRSLLTEARLPSKEGPSFNFKLRLVYMCNCFGGTTNDDWLAIGAKTSVGNLLMNWMPEPTITDFWNDFVTKDRRVRIAQDNAYSNASNLWQFVPGYTTPQTGGADVPGADGMTRIEETGHYQVLGEGDLIFKSEFQLALNQSVTFSVQANKTHNFPKVYLMPGKEYSFTTSSTDKWTNGISPFSTTVNANGYTPGPPDALRRHPANMMRLIGERFRHVDSAPLNANDGFVQNFINGSGFSIGVSRSGFKPGGFGFLNLYANDLIAAYGDNSGSISVTIKRTK